MRKKNVIFLADEEHIRSTLDNGFLYLYRPMGSKLFRAFIPEQLLSNTEVMDVIRTWALPRTVGGVYYIRATVNEILETLGDTLFCMDFDQFVIGEPSEEVWFAASLN